MSGRHIHSHAPHEHSLDAAHATDALSSRMAVLTAVLTAIGAFYSHEYGESQNELLILKNEIAVYQTRATNQWNYYQAKSGKQNLAKFASFSQGGDIKEFYKNEVERYQLEKNEIKDKAIEFEEKVTHAEHESELVLKTHKKWAAALTFIQAAVAVAAVAILSRKKILEFLCYGTGVAGVTIGLVALF